MPRAKILSKATLWVAIAIAGFALARLAPPLEGLTPLGQSVLGAAFAGTLLWISEAIPLGLTALLVLLLLGLSPGLRVTDVAGGFAGEVVFFLIGVVGLGTAVEASGLAARAARFLCRSAGSSPARLYLQLIAGIPVLALLVPSAITRNAILIPAYRDALATMGPTHVNHFEREGVLPIAFSLFHYTNMQDVSFAVISGEPVLWGEAWQARVRMAIDDHGKERTVDEMIHQRIGDYEAFGEYQRAVFGRTEAWLDGLDPTELTRVLVPRPLPPVVASTFSRWARNRTGHAEDSKRNPAKMATLLKMWIGFKCGSPRNPNREYHKWPKSWLRGSIPGNLRASQPDNK